MTLQQDLLLPCLTLSFILWEYPTENMRRLLSILLIWAFLKHRHKVRSYLNNQEDLKPLFCEVDLVLMPSRTDGFGLTGLEALSAVLPVIISKNSGFGEALGSALCGSLFVVNSEDPSDWRKAIKDIWDKDRKKQLEEVKDVRGSYSKEYSWSKQCEIKSY